MVEPSSGNAGAKIAMEIAWLVIDGFVLAGAVALGTAPDVTTLAFIGAVLLATGAVGDMVAHIGTIINVLNGEELISEAWLSSLKEISGWLQLAGAIISLPAIIKDFSAAVASQEARINAGIRNGGKIPVSEGVPAVNAAKNGKPGESVPGAPTAKELERGIATLKDVPKNGELLKLELRYQELLKQADDTRFYARRAGCLYDLQAEAAAEFRMQQILEEMQQIEAAMAKLMKN